MTETEELTNLADQPVRPTYEQIVEGIRHSGVREILTHADENERRMGYELERIANNEDLNDEAKERMAQDVLAKYDPKISEAYKSAKEKVAASAESAYKFSIPMPGDHKSLATTRISDASEMIAVQNETTALVTRAEALKAKASASDRAHQGGNDGIRLNYDPGQRVLKEAFDGAMEDGGVSGKIVGLAVMKAAEALGVDIETIVNDHRTDRHMRAIEDQRHFERAWRVLPNGKKASENPFTARRVRAANIGTYRSGNKAMAGGAGHSQMFEKRGRKRPWK